MAKLTSTGPGWMQVYKQDGQTWADNWAWYPTYIGNDNKRLGLATEQELGAPNSRCKNVFVPSGRTVENALRQLNGLPMLEDQAKKNFFDTYTQVIGKNTGNLNSSQPAMQQIPRPTGSFRPYVEGLTKDQVIAFLNEGAAELIRRDLREKEAEETVKRNAEYEAKILLNAQQERERINRQSRVFQYQQASKGLSNFMTGVVHALAIQRQLYRQEYKHPDPSPIVAGGKKLKTGADWTALDIARATKAYKSAKVRKKAQDPVDAKPPWEREAKEHLDFKLRQASAPGGWNVKKAEPVQGPAFNRYMPSSWK